MSRIYLDHAATTPILPEARAAMVEAMERWANPSSPHAEGRAARAALEDARARIKLALGWTGDLIFTSGASEALTIGLNRSKADRQLISVVEHDAVFRAAPAATTLPIVDGRVDVDVLANELRGGTRCVVAIQHVNSETGTSLIWNANDPVIAQVRDAGGLFLCDCSQSAGKGQLPQADLICVSAHKLGGPPGVGALLVRDFGMLEAEGGQEFGYRAGTQNLPGVLGFAAALEAMTIDDWATDAEQRFDFKNALYRMGEMISPGVQCSHIYSFAMDNMSAAAQLVRFDAMGFAISVGSACSSGSLKRSRTLTAFGVPDDVADRTIRVSIGSSTTVGELEAFAEAYAEVATEAKARAA